MAFRSRTILPASGVLVAAILAIGIGIALNTITVAVLYDAIQNPDNAGISENATQILTGWGGGIIGVIGALVGYKAGEQRKAEDMHSEQFASLRGDEDAAEAPAVPSAAPLRRRGSPEPPSVG
jgi:hypothetical protein